MASSSPSPAGPGHAVIVGGGIGGLAAAVGLRRAGWLVTVLERSAAPGEVGAGVSLWGNALAALEELGVASSIRARGTMTGEGGMRTPSGRWLSRSSGAAMQREQGMTVLMVHRAELHLQLRAALPDDAVIAGATATTVTQNDAAVSVDYTDSGGDHTLDADVVVGADGIHSRTRRALWPQAPPPAYARFTAWRGVTDGEFALQRQSQTWGPGAEFGATQLIDGRVYWFGTANEPEGARVEDEQAEVLRRFGRWHSPIAEIIEATSPTAVLRHDIYQHPRPLPPFTQGRVALLGDAAHAMTPGLGQGACIALEDAVQLAAELAGNEIAAALRRYDATRRPRAEALAKQSAQMSRIAQAGHPVATALRATLIAAMPARLGVASMARSFRWTPPRISPTTTSPALRRCPG